MGPNMQTKFIDLNEVCSHGSGGRILFATDDFFANAEMMLQDSEPKFIKDKYTDFGKWMDGWETRRKRIAGHDWCIVRLGANTVIRGLDVDTAFFTGNYVPRFSLQAAKLTAEDERMIPERLGEIGTACTTEMHEQMKKLNSDKWTCIVPMTDLKPGFEESRHNYIDVDNDEAWTHIRVNMYPDGGIARLRVYGDVIPNMDILNIDDHVDLMALQNGGLCLSYSNAHFGHPRNLIKSNRGVNMGDGWETARRLDRPAILENDSEGILNVPGEEWAVFRLCSAGIIDNIIVDTAHFKGNFPDSIRVEGAVLNSNTEWSARAMQRVQWQPILNSKKLSADREHYYLSHDLKNEGPFTHVRVTMCPDGGVSRIRMFGRIASSYA